MLDLDQTCRKVAEKKVVKTEETFSFLSSFAVDLLLKFPALCFDNVLVHERVCNIKMLHSMEHDVILEPNGQMLFPQLFPMLPL